MTAPIGHQAGSPYPKVNRAWRRIALAVLGSAAVYKVWRNYSRLDTDMPETYPGQFTGSSGIEQAERKSKYEGAGNTALGRRRFSDR